MRPETVLEVLSKTKDMTVAVCGDFCLDAYWLLGRQEGEASVETGLRSRVVNMHYYSLGGASNIVANLAALKPKEIYAIGIIGDDVFGREMVRQLQSLRVYTLGLIIQSGNFDTITFCKPYLDGEEQLRFDFGFSNKRSDRSNSLVLQHLRMALESVDVVIFNQQVPGSLSDDSFIEDVNKLFDEFDDKVVLFDSRHYGHRFQNVYRKTNDVEAAKLAGVNVEYGDVITHEDTRKHIYQLYEKTLKPVFITCGPRGIIVADAGGVYDVPGIELTKKLDTVGCGDTALSALALCLAAGASPRESAVLANFAAAVTAQKLFQTGTASGEEILQIAKGPITFNNLDS